MGFINSILILLAIAAFISWFNYYLLSRSFCIYRGRVVRYSYLFLTVVTMLVMGYGLIRRPPFTVPEHGAYIFCFYGALAWLVGQITLLVFQPVIHVVNRLIHKTVDVQDMDSSTLVMTRRVFLHNTLAVTPLIAFGNSARGIYEAQAEMVVQRYSLPIPELPPALNGFKISQISDTHLGPYFSLERLDKAIQLLVQEKPDLVVITGDFADDLNLLKPAIDRFNDLQPSIPYGIYFCYGNHEYFQNVELVREELHKSRIKILQNESALIVPGPQPFYLMGVDYPWDDNSHKGVNVSVRKRQECFAAANENVPPNAFKVLIAHHPDFLFDGFSAQISLSLAGHTHGGQVVIGGKSLLSAYAYMGGLYQENGVYGYVNTGAGHWFPFRIGCPPEISVFTLQR